MHFFLTNFLRQHEGVELVQEVIIKVMLIDSLEQNGVDISQVSMLPENLQEENIGLMENKPFLVGNQNQKSKRLIHDIAIPEEISLIYREPGSRTCHVMENLLYLPLFCIAPLGPGSSSL